FAAVRVNSDNDTPKRRTALGRCIVFFSRPTVRRARSLRFEMAEETDRPRVMISKSANSASPYAPGARRRAVPLRGGDAALCRTAPLERLAGQVRIIALLNRRVGCVHVDMDDLALSRRAPLGGLGHPT